MYASYKLEIQKQSVDSVYDKIREKSHYQTAELILNLSRELYKGMFESQTRFFLKMPEISEEIRQPLNDLLSKVPKNVVGNFDRWFDQARDKINQLMSPKSEFNERIKNTTVEELKKYLEKFDYRNAIEQKVAELSKGFLGKVNPSDTVFLDAVFYQQNVAFPLKVLALSPRVLSYVEMSRYPIRDCGYLNLKLFRELDAQLRPYFEYLVIELQMLSKEGDDYLGTIKKYQSVFDR